MNSNSNSNTNTNTKMESKACSSDEELLMDDDVSLSEASESTSVSGGSTVDNHRNRNRNNGSSNVYSMKQYGSINDSHAHAHTHADPLLKSALDETESITILSDTHTYTSTCTSTNNNHNTSPLRRIAIDLSLYLNLFILFSKLIAYVHTLSLSVLAALTDSLLDVISQLVLNYTERNSSKSRSSALYPAGAARLEPVGVLTCAALMGMASFEILKESIESLYFNGSVMRDHLKVNDDTDTDTDFDDRNMASVYGMTAIVIIKLSLYLLCDHAMKTFQPGTRERSATHVNLNAAVKQSVKVSDPTLEALALDHWNDALSNAVAAIALFAALLSRDLWFLDPLGAIVISIYIIYSWYETGKEQIEQLTGKSAPDEFIDELHDLASTFDKRMVVDVVRAYHFGPKFLVELEVVLPKDTLLMESHDLGMELQYEIEGREEVERCFVHIDYEMRPYDEHVVSKVPELRAKYRPSASNVSYCNHSV